MKGVFDKAQINIMGTVFDDGPKIREVGSKNTLISEITVKVRRSIKRGNGWDHEDTYYRVKKWGPEGKAMMVDLKRGDRVAVIGEFTIEKNEHNGKTYQNPTVWADAIGKFGAWDNNSSTGQSSGASTEVADDDDIPF